MGIVGYVVQAAGIAFQVVEFEFGAPGHGGIEIGFHLRILAVVDQIILRRGCVDVVVGAVHRRRSTFFIKRLRIACRPALGMEIAHQQVVARPDAAHRIAQIVVA